MKLFKKVLAFILLSISIASCSQRMSKDEIIEKYVTNCSKKYNYNIQMNEYQACLDKGLEIDSTVAYLWQQKAMPYFKAKKYEVGMDYINKAVKYDKEGYLPYRAFIKCIFAQKHKEAIKDFKECIQLYGNSYEMDHTYEFYIALSYLQLNEFKKAEALFEKNNNELLDELGEEWLHPTVLFYLGISKYELEKYDEAIYEFDRALKLYANFSDVKYYKSLCLRRIGRIEDAKKVYQEFLEDSENGFTINEDNVIYEVYPYQKKWVNR